MRKVLILLAVVFGATAIYYLVSQSNISSKEKVETGPQVVSLQHQERINLKKSKFAISKEQQVKSSFPPICHEGLKKLTSMTADEYKSFLTDKAELIHFFGKDCLNQLITNETFQKISRDFQCNLKHEKLNENSCMSLLFIMKAYFIADSSVGKDVNEMSPEELAANIAKMFFDLDKLNKENFKENISLISALHEMYPNDPDVMEAYIGYMMIGSKITQDKSAYSIIDEIMERSSGESFKVDRLQVFQHILNERPESTKQTLDKLNQLYPKEAELAYYYSAYYWKQGNRTMANNYLDRAILLSKNCSYCAPSVYHDTKKRINNAKEKDPNLFSLSIGLNFENL
jgi:tetratricopeptide (TPR) repeat protein